MAAADAPPAARARRPALPRRCRRRPRLRSAPCRARRSLRPGRQLRARRLPRSRRRRRTRRLLRPGRRLRRAACSARIDGAAACRRGGATARLADAAAATAAAVAVPPHRRLRPPAATVPAAAPPPRRAHNGCRGHPGDTAPDQRGQHRQRDVRERSAALTPTATDTLKQLASAAGDRHDRGHRLRRRRLGRSGRPVGGARSWPVARSGHGRGAHRRRRSRLPPCRSMPRRSVAARRHVWFSNASNPRDRP